jgi:hypothetical protein
MIAAFRTRSPAKFAAVLVALAAVASAPTATALALTFVFALLRLYLFRTAGRRLALWFARTLIGAFSLRAFRALAARFGVALRPLFAAGSIRALLPLV